MTASLLGWACADKVLDVSTGSGVAVGDACDPTDPLACGDELTCAPSGDPPGEFLCAGRVEIRGSVIDALTGSSIEGARVSAFDEAGIAATTVVQTDAEGRYRLPLVVPRDVEGEPSQRLQLTLMAAADDHVPFPGGLRPAVPVDTAQAMPSDEDGVAAVIEDASTTIALLPDARPGVMVSGRVEGEAAAGVLVVAEGPEPAPYTVTDLDGAFVLFDVPPGSLQLRGYRQGVELRPVALTVAADDLVDVRLQPTGLDPAQMGTIAGSVQIVNAPGGARTSVVLVPTSTFDAVLERGPVPAGLRLPPSPAAPDVAASFEITGVPAGRYTVLAASENDGLVRDPDLTIAGTQIQSVDVATGQAVELPSSFKITQAIAVVSPGADGPEPTEAVPLFTWIDDAGEDRYEIVVRDALGNEVWRDAELPKVTGSSEASVLYGGPPLSSGMIYQFRVIAWRSGTPDDTPISRTEDLRGVFVVR